MLSAISFNFVKKLQNRLYRRKFFRTTAQQDVAQQIRDLRQRQGKRQVDLAKAARMKQSAVSRLEQASYSRWNFATLLRVADSLDARVKIIFQPADEVIKEYARIEEERALLRHAFEENQKLADSVLAMPASGQVCVAQLSPTDVLGQRTVTIQPPSQNVGQITAASNSATIDPQNDQLATSL